jgi:hypothetical protein
MTDLEKPTRCLPACVQSVFHHCSSSTYLRHGSISIAQNRTKLCSSVYDRLWWSADRSLTISWFIFGNWGTEIWVAITEVSDCARSEIVKISTTVSRSEFVKINGNNITDDHQFELSQVYNSLITIKSDVLASGNAGSPIPTAETNEKRAASLSGSSISHVRDSFRQVMDVVSGEGLDYVVLYLRG